ncbi:4Fe-4S dicluster domain-containing protein [Candidatus Bipolaricaulota bacterium]
MRYAILNAEGGDRTAALRELLSQLLTQDVVQAVLVPKPLSGGSAVAQSLVTNPEELADSLPIAPTMPVQSARILSDLTMTPFEGRIAAVLKPCEHRASVELAKFLQVNTENILTIGVDCFGTCDVSVYAEMSADQRNSILQQLASGSIEENQVREACQMCTHPAAFGVDLGVGFIGAEPSGSMSLLLGDRHGDVLVEALSLEATDVAPAARAQAVDALVSGRKQYRAKALETFASDTASLDGMMEALSACIGCRNCMSVCPICYCKECVFDSTVFDHRADQLLARARRKGAMRIPTETLMFHLTRLSHMGTSCVGCGVCESACPNDVPVSSLFNSVGEKLQALFDYVPGDDPATEPPVAAFKEKELVEVAPND